jgi:hypothetical protein
MQMECLFAETLHGGEKAKVAIKLVLLPRSQSKFFVFLPNKRAATLIAKFFARRLVFFGSAKLLGSLQYCDNN